MMRKEGITVIPDTKIQHIKGDYKIDSIHFSRNNSGDKNSYKVQNPMDTTDYFIKPDVVIVESGIGPPRNDLKEMIGHEEAGDLNSFMYTNEGIPISNIRFSMYQNDIMSPILAAGNCTHYPSFMHKMRVRTDDIKYNIEAGFYAAMNMLDKQVEFRYLPMTPLTIGEKKLYFVGERDQPITGLIIKGKLSDEKWVVFFTYGDEVCGFLTCGY